MSEVVHTQYVETVHDLAHEDDIEELDKEETDPGVNSQRVHKKIKLYSKKARKNSRKRQSQPAIAIHQHAGFASNFFEIQHEEFKAMNPDVSDVIGSDLIEIEKTFAVLCKPTNIIKLPREVLLAPKIEVVK